MLRTRDLTVAGAPSAWGDISLAAGDVAAITGPNGTGKSTLMRALAGLAPHSGVVEIDGRDVGSFGAEERLRAGLALVPAGRRLFGSLTVAQNLWVATSGTARAAARASVDRALDSLPTLRARGSQRATTLSGGEGQLLMIARALVSSPRVLLVDEPLEGLSPEASEQVLDLLRATAAGGAAVLVAAPDEIAGVRGLGKVVPA